MSASTIRHVLSFSGSIAFTVEEYGDLCTAGETVPLLPRLYDGWGRSTPVDLSAITQPTLIANGDNDRMAPAVLSEDLRRRIAGSKLVIYPNSGHGGIFPYHHEFAAAALTFIDG
jgi:pimeloyl-ACP methyl ester carboxylesterase